MSEFKFACPVCGQHISCDTTKAGSQMECPTCFQKLTVPQAPGDESSKFILTASKVQTRPIPQVVINQETPVVKKQFPFAIVGLVLVLGAMAAAGVVFRDKIFGGAQKQDIAQASSSGSTSKPSIPDPATLTSTDPNWKLDLADVTFPEAATTGKIHGRDFVCERSVLHGGKLDLRQGPKWPPDLGLTLYLIASRSEELAGKSFNIGPDMASPPKVALRWKNEQGEAQTQNIKASYACRVEFGQVASGYLSGKIYICTPDDDRSWAAGTFNAEIRKAE
jgi:hypothetical protein